MNHLVTAYQRGRARDKRAAETVVARFRNAQLSLSKKKWQAKVERLAIIYGWRPYCTRLPTGSNKGFPCLMVMRRNRRVVAEIKSERCCPTPEQLDRLDAFSEYGAETYVWWPHDLAEVVRILRK